MALKRLMNEYKTIKKDPNYYYSVSPSEENFLNWSFSIIGPNDTIYEGGIFKGNIIFKEDYPIRAPKVNFINIIHPNVHNNGDVCISILHEGSDSWGYENDVERWNPSHGVDSIMISIISMLSDPNFESPANVTYSVLWKDNPEEYKKLVYKLVSQSN
jgi:ubiquitin-conjugating enzyme E2 G1